MEMETKGGREHTHVTNVQVVVCQIHSGRVSCRQLHLVQLIRNSCSYNVSNQCVRKEKEQRVGEEGRKAKGSTIRGTDWDTYEVVGARLPRHSCCLAQSLRVSHVCKVRYLFFSN